MTIYVSNAFSLSMLPEWRTRPWDDGESENAEPLGASVLITPVLRPEEFLNRRQEAGNEIQSVVGHADTAALFSSILNRPIKENRMLVALMESDQLLVGQYMGPRLPEGCKTLPEGASISWLLVEVGDVTAINTDAM
jgi:hypothetical protein